MSTTHLPKHRIFSVIGRCGRALRARRAIRGSAHAPFRHTPERFAPLLSLTRSAVSSRNTHLSSPRIEQDATENCHERKNRKYVDPCGQGIVRFCRAAEHARFFADGGKEAFSRPARDTVFLRLDRRTARDGIAAFRAAFFEFVGASRHAAGRTAHGSKKTPAFFAEPRVARNFRPAAFAEKLCGRISCHGS